MGTAVGSDDTGSLSLRTPAALTHRPLVRKVHRSCEPRNLDVQQRFHCVWCGLDLVLLEHERRQLPVARRYPAAAHYLGHCTQIGLDLSDRLGGVALRQRSVLELRRLAQQLVDSGHLGAPFLRV